jgi:hypothetical protein
MLVLQPLPRGQLKRSFLQLNGSLQDIAMRRGARYFKEIFMADDPKKKPTEQSGYKQGQKPGQESEQSHKDQQDISKRNPSRQDRDEEQDNQQQGDKRRAS